MTYWTVVTHTVCCRCLGCPQRVIIALRVCMERLSGICNNDSCEHYPQNQMSYLAANIHFTAQRYK